MSPPAAHLWLLAAQAASGEQAIFFLRFSCGEVQKPSSPISIEHAPVLDPRHGAEETERSC